MCVGQELGAVYCMYVRNQEQYIVFGQELGTVYQVGQKLGKVNCVQVRNQEEYKLCVGNE